MIKNFSFLILFIGFSLCAQDKLPKDEQLLLEKYIREISHLADKRDNSIHKDFAINLDKDAEGILTKDSFYKFKAYTMYMANKVSNIGGKKADKDALKDYDEETEELINTSYSEYIDRIKNPVTNAFVEQTELALNLDDDMERDAVPYSIVHKSPVFRGHKKSLPDEDQRKCMTEKMNSYIAKNFDLKLIKELQINQSQSIYVRFKVNVNGDVKDVEARSLYLVLNQEGERVVNLLPKMLPARAGGKPVNPLYTLPIIFQAYQESLSNEIA